MSARLKWPGSRDPRWLILAFLACYDLYALTRPQFGRRPGQWAAGIAAAVLTDAAFLAWRRLALVPLSGLITSLGLLLLLDSPHFWPYALGGFLSIASKHLVRVDGRHLFNPLNFGIVALVLLLPSYATADAGRWGNTSLLVWVLVGLGALASWAASRLPVAAAYVVTFTAGAWARSLLWTAPMAITCAPMTGAGFHLFAFYMITDPATTPGDRRSQLVYGALIGVLDAALRQAEYRYAPFLALFLLSATRPFWQRLTAGRLRTAL